MASDLKQTRNVDADMARAFGVSPPGLDVPGSDGAGVALPAPAAEAATPPPPPARQPRRWLLIAAPLLVGLFVVALAVRFALTLVPGNLAAPAAQPTRAAAAYSASTPVTPPAAPAPAAPATPAERDALPPDDFGPAPVDPTPAAPAAPPRPAPRPVDQARRAAPDCPPGSREDRCIFADVLAADRRLRRGYARAAQAGVPTDELVAIRRRWSRARAISLDAPDETIRRYDDLTAALDDLIETEQR